MVFYSPILSHSKFSHVWYYNIMYLTMYACTVQYCRSIASLFPQYIYAPANGPSEELKALSRKSIHPLLTTHDYYGFSVYRWTWC